jgi:hypothetical protein
MIRYTLFTLMCLSVCASATAQVIEIGAGIGRACVGTDGSVCGEDRGAIWSIHSSIWFACTLNAHALLGPAGRVTGRSSDRGWIYTTS